MKRITNFSEETAQKKLPIPASAFFALAFVQMALLIWSCLSSPANLGAALANAFSIGWDVAFGVWTLAVNSRRASA